MFVLKKKKFYVFTRIKFDLLVSFSSALSSRAQSLLQSDWPQEYRETLASIPESFLLDVSFPEPEC